MTTFALLHGGAHGGWCWEMVAPLLRARGHNVVTPDLPIEDASAGALQLAQTAVDALKDCKGDVIVVGHSMGGLTTPVLASLRPVRHMVFLGALVPMPGLSFAEYAATQPGAMNIPLENIPRDDQGRFVFQYELAHEIFYADCSQEVSEHAWQRFRPQAVTSMFEPCPLKTWPNVPATYILMQEDRAVGPDWSRKISLERFGKPAIELPGSHSPFFSRPQLLVDTLLAI